MHHKIALAFGPKFVTEVMGLEAAAGLIFGQTATG
jgi:hypothetical protein